jgi:hypothetical protein
MRKYTNSSVDYAEKGFITFAPVAKVIKLFKCNYAAISITSVKIIRKYTDNCMNYTEKGFITLTPVAKVIKLF